MSEFKGVWVFSDRFDLFLEMLGKARELADKLQSELVAVLIDKDTQDRASELVKHGADKVFLVGNLSLERFQAEACLGVMHDLVVKHKPEIVMVGSTKNGKPLAARLATRLGVGCVPDCARLSVDGQGRLVGERITYGGNAVAKVALKTKPQIVTVPEIGRAHV
jgi:electron transfer flavoprotein alpha subunit